MQCPSDKELSLWVDRLTSASEHVSGGMIEKQFTEATRLQRIAHMDQTTQRRINRLEGTLHNLSKAVTTAQKEAFLGSRGVSKFEDHDPSAGMQASAAHFSQKMFELRQKSKIEAAATGTQVEKVGRSLHDLHVVLNVVNVDLRLQLADTILSWLPTLSVVAFVVTSILVSMDVAAPALAGILFSLVTPWVKIAIAAQVRVLLCIAL